MGDLSDREHYRSPGYNWKVKWVSESPAGFIGFLEMCPASLVTRCSSSPCSGLRHTHRDEHPGASLAMVLLVDPIHRRYAFISHSPPLVNSKMLYSRISISDSISRGENSSHVPVYSVSSHG